MWHITHKMHCQVCHSQFSQLRLYIINTCVTRSETKNNLEFRLLLKKFKYVFVLVIMIHLVPKLGMLLRKQCNLGLNMSVSPQLLYPSTCKSFSSLQLLVFVFYSKAPFIHLPPQATVPTCLLCSLKTQETTEWASLFLL